MYARKCLEKDGSQNCIIGGGQVWKQAQRPFFTCFFGHGQKACAQPSQGVSELMPEKKQRSATYFGKISAIYQRE